MNIKKYGYALIIVVLIAFTVFLSVRHEQKEMAEESVVTEDGKDSEMQAGDGEESEIQTKVEETVKIEPDAAEEKATQKGTKRAKRKIRCDHFLYHDMLSDDYPTEEIPFVDEETFALIREAYAEVDFSAEFEQGDPAVYEECKLAFRCMIRNETPFLDRETGEDIYIKDQTDLEYVWGYYFFDMNGDEVPELCIDDLGISYVFSYDSEKDQCILWQQLEYMTIIGTRKAVVDYEDLGSDIVNFVQLDSDGNVEFDAMFFSQPMHLSQDDIGDPVINMVMFPNYADREKEWELTEEMKQQGVFEASSGQWFFRITDEQFEELKKPYIEGVDWERRRAESYTYEELFGTGYVDDELYAEIKDICSNIDFDVAFNPGDVTKYELYKEKYKNLIDDDSNCVRFDETREKWRCFDLGEFRTDIFLKRRDYKDEHRYYFFDMNGDENPELCVTDNRSFLYVLQYDEEKDQIVLWKEFIPGSVFFMGTLNVGFSSETGGDGLIRFDENGNRDWFVRFVAIGGEPARSDDENYGYLIYLPEYIELTYDMQKQAVYDVVEERYYFRVTEEQFKELTKDYYDAVKKAQDALDDVTYTYTELFE